MRIFMMAALALTSVGAHAAPTIDKLTMPKRYNKASIDSLCGTIKYSLSTGTGGGICGSGKTVAECTDGKGNSSNVTCSTGCSAKGKGSCKIP